MLITLLVMAAWGMASVVAQIRPFWIDEWRIIYNLKFLSATAIWGKLAFMQQFPRVYLFLLKLFTSACGYSYTSLRLIPYLAGLAAIWCIYDTARRIYGPREPYRYLMVMMLISCSTFTEYFVEVKQYSMELLLSAAALWQLHYLLRLGDRPLKAAGYALFCMAMLLCPFFSYTYAIVIAPVYGVVLLHNIATWNNGTGNGKMRTIVMQWIPLCLCTFSITVFYLVDAAHLSADGDMQNYWRHLMPGGRTPFAERMFHFLAQAGSGLLFWWLFGLACTGALGWAIFRVAKAIRKRDVTVENSILLYALLVVLLVVTLNQAGRLPLGEPRLNAFGVPALSVLLIALLQALRTKARKKLWPDILAYLLLAGLTGNIYSTIAACFTDGKYAQRMETYRASEKALQMATGQHLPILVTPEVAYPYNGTENLPWRTPIPGDWVLMTWPAYDAADMLPIYAVPDTNDLGSYLQRLPTGTARVMVGNGISYRVVDVMH
ncbi:hypothetical protein GCM10023093_03970 [Nemorincola caseinilytica]|uniref:Glycosyltransferase RgtA/B/C/D-like domain-containing protein n=1 Tax=Nemorincola caseinilytica TaxID=2054315 RepID=A0ABP8N7Y8_9BACT